MRDTVVRQRPEDFAAAFERAFSCLQVHVETAGDAEAGWPDRVAAAIRAAFALAAADPLAAQALIVDPLAAGAEGRARYDRMVEYFGGLLRAGRDLRAEDEYLPPVVERALVGGLATLVATRLERGRAAELPDLAPEAIQFVLTPYLGSEEACRIAAQAA
jgi:hypothetical protein